MEHNAEHLLLLEVYNTLTRNRLAKGAKGYVDEPSNNRFTVGEGWLLLDDYRTEKLLARIGNVLEA